MKRKNFFLLVSLTSISMVLFSQTKPSQTKTNLDHSWFKTGTVHLISSSHQDIAWMDSPENCEIFRDEKMITPALSLLRADPDYCYSIENALYLKEYLIRHPESYDEILRYTREGRLEWGATYNQQYESMPDGEALIRQTYFGRKWLKKMLPGCDFLTAWSVDIPGRALQMPQILAKSGIKYFMISRHEPGFYNWYSPDGTNVLCFSNGHYQNFYFSIIKKNNDENKRIPIVTNILNSWSPYYKERKIKPEFPLLLSGDWMEPSDLNSLLSQWNKPVSESPPGLPKMKYSITSDALKDINSGDADIEKITGERPNIWLYIHGPTHHRALKASRDANRLLPQAEIFSTVNSVIENTFSGYPFISLNNAWENAIYPEHGWGGKHGDITDSLFRAKFETARDSAKDILNRALVSLSHKISIGKTGIPIVVFNSLSWERTDAVKTSINVYGNSHNNFKLIDCDGNQIPYQTIKATSIGANDEVLTIVFIAEKVPSVGYKTYYLQQSESVRGNVWDYKDYGYRYENKFFKIEFADGGIKSLYDKELKEELFRTDKFLGAEFFTMQSVGTGASDVFIDVEKPTMDFFEKMSNYGPHWNLIESGPVRKVWEISRAVNYCSVVERVIIYDALKKIDIELEINGFTGEQYREFRLAFPVNKVRPAVAYAVPMGIVEVGKSEMEGAGGFYKEGFQNYSILSPDIHPREVQDWFAAYNNKSSLTISSDVSVFDYLDPTTDPVDYIILQPLLLASRKSCHKQGNYYLQPGNHNYSFSLYSRSGNYSNSFQDGMSPNHPFQVIVSSRSRKTGTLPEQNSFAGVSQKNIIISTIKKCDDDDNIIIRCFDIEGKDADVVINWFGKVTEVEQTNMIEEDGKPLPFNGKDIRLPVGHHAIETIKIK